MSTATIGTKIVDLMKSAFATDAVKAQWIDTEIEKAKDEATRKEEKRIEHIIAELNASEITAMRNLCRFNSRSEKPDTLRTLLNYKLPKDSNVVVHNSSCMGCDSTKTFAMISIGPTIEVLDGNNAVESTERGVVDIFIDEEQAKQLYVSLLKLFGEK